MNWKKLCVSVYVPVKPETLARIEAGLKSSPGAECGPATWRSFMPEAKECSSVYEEYSAVEVLIAVDEHYLGGYFYSALARPGEAPDEGGRSADPIDALLKGVSKYAAYEDYGDIPEVAYLM